MLKLNLGCGYRKLEGFINVDHDKRCNPDVCTDLEQELPFKENTVSEIVMCHSLEHLGQNIKTYLNIWKELYRVLVPNGKVFIWVPHHLSEAFHNDPTHCRKVTLTSLRLFDQQLNLYDIARGNAATTLGLQNGIDFKIGFFRFGLDPEFEKEMEGKDYVEVANEVHKRLNVCHELYVELHAVKPGRGTNGV